MALTIDELYERYMDIEEYAGEGAQEFAYDVYDVFSMGKTLEFGKEDWAVKYGMYLPSYDPTTVQLAERERIMDMTEARDLWEVSKSAADRVYKTEQDTLRASLGKEMGKARQMSGRQGLRTGAIESAMADTIEASSSRVKDLGDRYTLQNKADLDKHNTSMVDATLDFDKSEHAAKEEFYDKTMAAIDRLTTVGAFAQSDVVGPGGEDENTSTMANNIEGCVELLGPKPVPGTSEFDANLDILYSDDPTESYEYKSADCAGVPFIPPGDWSEDDWDFDLSAFGF